MTNDELRWRISRMLRDLIIVSLRASADEIAFGHPCSYLIEEVVGYGMDMTVDYILTNPHHGEYRLNGAGLKLYWFFSRERFHFVVSGDQVDKYPVTVPKLREVIKQHGFQQSN